MNYTTKFIITFQAENYPLQKKRKNRQHEVSDYAVRIFTRLNHMITVQRHTMVTEFEQPLLLQKMTTLLTINYGIGST